LIIDADSRIVFIQHADFDKFYRKFVKKDPALNQITLFPNLIEGETKDETI